MTKVFKTPFGALGDKQEVPVPTQTDGSVSYEQGFGVDYQRDYEDPQAKDIPREGLNQLFYDVTNALGRVQVQGAASWSADGAPYQINAQTYHYGKQWLALRANSVEPVEGADWTELVGKKYVDDSIPDLAGYLQPSMTGSATLNGTTDNAVSLTGIITALGLEVGDVIRIQYTGYNKLHTVESITDNNSIIVNYEHAGNRGNGSLKLADRTATVTIKRIEKWYNAPIGLGQDWVNVEEIRVHAATYTNTTGRHILAILDWYVTAATSIDVTVGGVNIAKIRRIDGNTSNTGSTTFLVPAGQTYGTYFGTYSDYRLVELR